MLGLGDVGIFLAYTLCIVSALCCVVYGIVNWNKGGDDADDEKDKAWKEEEEKLEENLS